MKLMQVIFWINLEYLMNDVISEYLGTTLFLRNILVLENFPCRIIPRGYIYVV